MIIPVSLKVSFDVGSTPTSLVATPSLIGSDGATLVVFDSIPLSVGTDFTVGPLAVVVNIETNILNTVQPSDKPAQTPQSTAGLSKGQLPPKSGR